MKTFIMITLLVFIILNQGWTLCIGSGCGRNVVNENGVKTEAWNTGAYPGGILQRQIIMIMIYFLRLIIMFYFLFSNFKGPIKTKRHVGMPARED